MPINPLEQVVNLRDQASKSVKEQTLYEPTRVGGWITWPEVQETRVKAIAAYNALAIPTHKQRLTALKEAVMISFMSLLPPDRVGVVRRLRFKHTLVRRAGGGWRLDLSQRKDGHKTSKHYGPYCTALPDALTDVLNKLSDALELDGEGADEAYLFGPNHSIDRPYESAAWTMAVKRAFAKHYGREVAPKTVHAIA